MDKIIKNRKQRRNKRINRHGEEEIRDFPYEELLKISPLDLYTQEKCLPILIEFSKKDTFYQNLKDVRIVMEFLTMNLSSCDDKNYTENIIFSQLSVISEIVKNLNTERLSFVTNVENIFKIISHLGPLDIFSECSTRISLQILLTILTPLKMVPEKAKTCLLAVRKKLQQTGALKDLAQYCGFVFHKFPHKNCGIFNWSFQWVITETVDILDNDEIDKNALELKSALMHTILELWQTIAEPLSQESPRFLSKKWKKFIEKLTAISVKIIKYCGKKPTNIYAKGLLDLILLNFMEKEYILNEETSNILNEDLKHNLPLRLCRWPSVKHLSFFWICHLLFTNDSCLWSPKQVSKAISDLIFSKDHSIIRAETLKSVCYIYPRLFKKSTYLTNSTYFLGENILKYIEYFSNIPISKILSFDVCQLVWILSCGSQELKESTLKWWLLKSNVVTTEVKYLIKANEIEPVILDILVHNEQAVKESDVLSESCIELIKELQNPFIARATQYHLLNNSFDNYDLFSKLIRTRPKVPKDKNLAVILLRNACYFLPVTIEEETFKETCRFVRYILKDVQAVEAVEFISKSDFFIKFLTVRLRKNRDFGDMAEEIVKLLIVLVQFQRKSTVLLDPVTILDLTLLLENTKDQNLNLYLDLFCKIALSGSFSTLKSNENVTNLALILMNLSGADDHSTRSNFSLRKLLKAHQWLAEFSLFGQFLEHRCFFLRRSTSVSFLKLLYAWIELMSSIKRRANVILPNRQILEPYILRCNVKPKIVQSYMMLLDNIYRGRRKINEK